jgi:hypothetical protein
MLSATQKEIDRVTGYMGSQAPDLTAEFIQKDGFTLHVDRVAT